MRAHRGVFLLACFASFSIGCAAPPLVSEIEGGDRVVLERTGCEGSASARYLARVAEGVEYGTARWELSRETAVRLGIAAVPGCWRENADGYLLLFDDRTLYLLPKEQFAPAVDRPTGESL